MPLRFSYSLGFMIQPRRLLMGLGGAAGSEFRFAAYLEGLASVIGHKDRSTAFLHRADAAVRTQKRGVDDGETAPARTAAEHQSLFICRKSGRPTARGGAPRAVVLLDTGYGNNRELRAGITGLDLIEAV